MVVCVWGVPSTFYRPLGLPSSADSQGALAKMVQFILISSLGFMLFAQANPVAQKMGWTRLIMHHS